MKTFQLFCKTTFLLVFFVLISCEEEPVSEDRNDIAQFKGDDWEDHLGEEVTIEAYLVLTPTPTLHFTLEDRLKNTIIPESRYFRLKVDEELFRDWPDSYHGAKVRLTGTIARDQDQSAGSLSEILGSSYFSVLDVKVNPEILVASSIGIDKFNNICQASNICDFITPFNPETYIMLFSGGINASSAYSRYWNDMVFFYTIMAWYYGVDAGKMRIVYKDGTQENGYMPVHYAATIDGVNEAFEWFEEEMDGDDTFIFFATNHGGTNYTDFDNDDDNSFNNGDEAIFYYNQSGRIEDDELADMINGLNFGRMLAILEPCFAGGLLPDLQGPNRVMVSASKEDQVSWGGYQNYGNSYDDFIYLFTAALAGQHADGTSVDADTDNNGKVSIAEAFEWARVEDTADEIPQIESDNDGVPSSTAGGESGSAAENFYIN